MIIKNLTFKELNNAIILSRTQSYKFIFNLGKVTKVKLCLLKEHL